MRVPESAVHYVTLRLDPCPLELGGEPNTSPFWSRVAPFQTKSVIGEQRTINPSPRTIACSYRIKGPLKIEVWKSYGITFFLIFFIFLLTYTQYNTYNAKHYLQYLTTILTVLNYNTYCT